MRFLRSRPGQQIVLRSHAIEFRRLHTRFTQHNLVLLLHFHWLVGIAGKDIRLSIEDANHFTRRIKCVQPTFQDLCLSTRHIHQQQALVLDHIHRQIGASILDPHLCPVSI